MAFAVNKLKYLFFPLKERERLQSMMAHLHMTKDAVGTAQEKREVNATPSEKKTTEHANTGKTKKYCQPERTFHSYQ